MQELLSDMLTNKSQQPTEIPDKFPNIIDWVIYIWAEDAYTIASKEVPMIFKVTSGDPDTGLIAGYAMTDPALAFKDAAGITIPTPPLIPVPSAPYSSKPKRLHWLHISDFRDHQIRLMKDAQEQEQAD